MLLPVNVELVNILTILAMLGIVTSILPDITCLYSSSEADCLSQDVTVVLLSTWFSVDITISGALIPSMLSLTPLELPEDLFSEPLTDDTGIDTSWSSG